MTMDNARRLPSPVLILGLPRSYTSMVCTMIGQHPEMYGLPETHLFCEPTMEAWLQRAKRASWPMADGLLRTVAQLYFGAQNAVTVKLARDWLSARSNVSTDRLFRVLADRVFPLAVVDKSPSTIDSLKVMRRALDRFPDARFIHLVRHPRSYGESVITLIREKEQIKPLPAKHWLLRLASSRATPSVDKAPSQGTVLDPQDEWYSRNVCIRDFLQAVPAGRQLRLRGEDFFIDPDVVLRGVARWMDVRTDEGAIEEMKHPERSPFACLGPPGALYGNDGHFLSAPVLRSGGGAVGVLDGPLSWRSDNEGFRPEVRALAEEFAYE